jgi:hypothetical protein
MTQRKRSGEMPKSPLLAIEYLHREVQGETAGVYKSALRAFKSIERTTEAGKVAARKRSAKVLSAR